MKDFCILLILISSTLFSQAQSTLPIDFESGNDVFINFSGGEGTVISNPQINGINTSTTVGQIVKGEGSIWAGSKLVLSSALDFTTNNSIRIKVFSPRANMPIRLNLEKESDETTTVNNIRKTTVSNQWEEIIFNFAGNQSETYNVISFMFDYGTVGDGLADFTFLIDDISFEYNTPPAELTQIDLPVDFEGNTTNYSLIDFAGNLSYFVSDPENQNNSVVKTIKTISDETQTHAGTIVGTDDGFASQIPFSNGNTFISVKLYSPVSGIPVRLKIEDYLSGIHTVETEVINSKINEWETLVFNFSNHVAGSATLDVNYTYNKLSIFFDFGGEGNDFAYYWDDVYFGNTSSINDSDFKNNRVKIFPNPANDEIQITALEITEIEIYTVLGKKIKTITPFDSENVILPIAELEKGIYIISVTTNGHKQNQRFVKQ